jgi:hypothetical protein
MDRALGGWSLDHLDGWHQLGIEAHGPGISHGGTIYARRPNTASTAKLWLKCYIEIVPAGVRMGSASQCQSSLIA